jgi:hypothetical protein
MATEIAVSSSPSCDFRFVANNRENIPTIRACGGGWRWGFRRGLVLRKFRFCGGGDFGWDDGGSTDAGAANASGLCFSVPYDLECSSGGFNEFNHLTWRSSRHLSPQSRWLYFEKVLRRIFLEGDIIVTFFG